MTSETLVGVDAVDFIKDELTLVARNDQSWTRLYKQKTNGALWITHYLNSENHGGGTLNLVPLEPVEGETQ